MWVRHCALVLLIAARSVYTAVNRTIDDSDATITYLPSGQWSQRGSCSDCTVSPDSSRAQGGTWHSATYRADDGAPPSIEVQFTGTGLFLYNILATPSSGSTDADTHLQFYWDGTYDEGSDFDWESAWGSSGGADFQYDQLVYYITGLEQGQHTVRVQPKVDRDSLILFDYAEYTTDHLSSVSNPEPVSDPTRSSSVTNPEPASNPAGSRSSVISSTASPGQSRLHHSRHALTSRRHSSYLRDSISFWHPECLPSNNQTRVRGPFTSIREQSPHIHRLCCCSILCPPVLYSLGRCQWVSSSSVITTRS